VDYVRGVRELYGEDWPAARYLGLSVAHLRQLLARPST
jgi:hypothetical protein